ncbi:GNAT family N-acetyltransferase [Phyllobacterium meliloti]|uniref:GNAT family N-acetyltransferase n=1 Tax=Phyllobacterium meliloti TaxID=555317 RepID=UPI001D157D34|nr:GNAT family N-acetyltransferase [Phyllobacterium sp. T1293]UGX87160.1 GNAT family N-acetyltransferase [Phyllobacterium sp. T1293]
MSGSKRHIGHIENADNIFVKMLEPSDFERIKVTNGGAAWNTDQKLWDQYLAEQHKEERIILLAIQELQVVGYVTLAWLSAYDPFREDDIPEINNLVVAQQARGGGIATLLIAKLEQLARDTGKTKVGIGVGLYADYGPAQKLYFKLGYTPDGNGITYDGKPVIAGEHYCVDDELILWMTKAI